MTSVFDVSKYILEQSGSMSAMKLQKLVYYTQVWHLVATERPLFKERIQAFAHGPVVYSLWKSNEGKTTLTSSDVTCSHAALSEMDEEIIDAVLRKYGELSAAQLRSLTHRELPWLEARSSEDDEISARSMYAFYSRQLVNGSDHPTLPSWATVLVSERSFKEMTSALDVPDDVSSLVSRARKMRAQLA